MIIIIIYIIMMMQFHIIENLVVVKDLQNQNNFKELLENNVQLEKQMKLEKIKKQNEG